jgi:TPR repeat protein
MSVKLVRCEEGHVFDQADSQICPACGAGVANGSKPPIKLENKEDNQAPAQDESHADDKNIDRDKSRRLPVGKRSLYFKFFAAAIALVLVFLLATNTLAPGVVHQAKKTEPDTQSRSIAAGLSLSNSALVALEIQIAYMAYKRGNYGPARSIFERLAEDGSPVAQYYLSDIYARGLNAKVDEDAAVDLLERSAGSGDSFAQVALGQRYETGKGVNLDMNKAREYYLQAALQRNDVALQAVRRLNIDLANVGLDLKAIDDAYSRADYATAFPSAEEFAKKGRGYAEHLYGLMFYYGQGTERNEEQALYWLRSSAEKGVAFGQWMMGRIYAQGTAGIAKNIGEAAVWYRLALYNNSGTSREKLKQEVQNFWPQVPAATAQMIDALLPLKS